MKDAAGVFSFRYFHGGRFFLGGGYKIHDSAELNMKPFVILFDGEGNYKCRGPHLKLLPPHLSGQF